MQDRESQIIIRPELRCGDLPCYLNRVKNALCSLDTLIANNPADRERLENVYAADCKLRQGLPKKP